MLNLLTSISRARTDLGTAAVAAMDACGLGEDCSSRGSGEKSKRSSKLTVLIVAINRCWGGETASEGEREREERNERGVEESSHPRAEASRRTRR